MTSTQQRGAVRSARWPILAVVAMSLSLVLGCGEADDEPGAEAETPPSVLLISIDTLRADHMSVYGYERPTTPHLEELAREAVVFDRFYYSGGGTLPSHLSIMTSLHPYTHGVTPDNGLALPEGRATLAERLREEGYSTAAFVDDGWMQAKFGFAQGFDLYDDVGGRFEAILPKAQGWLEEEADEPFFLFLHTYDVHSAWNELPYECPDDYPLRFVDRDSVEFTGCRDGKCASELLAWVNQEVREDRVAVNDYFTAEELEFMSSLYDGCISYVDDRLADLFGLLRELGLYESSMIVVTSDHGEEFGEHGMMIHDQGGYEELSRIPLLVKLPDGLKAGLRVEHLAATVDIAPTILEILRLPGLEEAQGHSLVPSIFRDEPVRPDIHMYTALYKDRMKFFRNRNELYDLEADPGEQENLYVDRDETVRRLRARIDEMIRSDRAALAAFNERSSSAEEGVELTEEDVERLKALGYLQ